MKPNAFEKTDYLRNDKQSKSAAYHFYDGPAVSRNFSKQQDEMIIEDMVDDEVQVEEPQRNGR